MPLIMIKGEVKKSRWKKWKYFLLVNDYNSGEILKYYEFETDKERKEKIKEIARKIKFFNLENKGKRGREYKKLLKDFAQEL